jgi:ABC-type Fe3+/spermidine/putrescine transport system ATPase subunit
MVLPSTTAPSSLDRVSLTVAAGEFLTILQTSGSGKTTLLKVVAGFEFPDAGRVAVGGIDITDVSPAKPISAWCSRTTRSGRT